MAKLLCNNDRVLKLILFGQRLSFRNRSGAVTAAAVLRPMKDVTEEPSNVLATVQQAIAWFDESSPRSDEELSCFGQTIRLRESAPDELVCEVLHDGAVGAYDHTDQIEPVLTVMRDWLVNAGIE